MSNRADRLLDFASNAMALWWDWVEVKWPRGFIRLLGMIVGFGYVFLVAGLIGFPCIVAWLLLSIWEMGFGEEP